jgi:chromosome segregation and condensation protein ScpB
MSDLKAIIESLIFASPEPLTIKALVRLLDTEPKEDIVAAVDALKGD